MSIGIIGKKVGMTRIYTDKGVAIPVTVIDVADNVLLQEKTLEKDGYRGVQVGYDDQKEARVNRPAMGHFKKHGSETPKREVREFRLADGEATPETHPGIDTFEEGQWVDVIGTTKGKGFQGTVKRYKFAGQPASHGSMMHRRPGSIGCRLTPGRVWKNQKMPGRQGNYNRTVQNLQIVAKRPDDNVLLISGAVPGARGGYVVIRPAKKKNAPAVK